MQKKRALRVIEPWRQPPTPPTRAQELRGAPNDCATQGGVLIRPNMRRQADRKQRLAYRRHPPS